jgi:hypothetical protein
MSSKKHPSKETRKEKKKALLSSSFAKVAVHLFSSLIISTCRSLYLSEHLLHSAPRTGYEVAE